MTEQDKSGLAVFVEKGLGVAGNVGMDEVVNVFVSRFEEQLFEKKNTLSNEIRMAKQSLTDQNKRLEESVDKSKYVLGDNVLNLQLEVGDVNVKWDRHNHEFKPDRKKPNNAIEVEVHVVSAYDRDRVVDYIEISEEEVKMRQSIKTELENLNRELQSVMEQIRDVGRKERQIRAKISASKLEQSGFAELVNDPELMKLVQL